MENFKFYLKEAEVQPTQVNDETQVDPQVAQQVDQIIKLPYQEFVTQLAAIANDPKVKAVLQHGLKDGKPTDEVVRINKINVPVTRLKPTQNEVDIDKSLAYPLNDQKSFLKYLTATGAVKAGPNAIVTAAGGTLVIDGHHRWSQVYAINKDAVMEAVDINIEGASPETYLKVVQMAIAADLGKLPVANTGPGINLLDASVTREAINGYISKKITNDVANAAGADGTPLRSSILQKIGGGLNEKVAPKPSAAVRAAMRGPQTMKASPQAPLDGQNAQKMHQRGIQTIQQLIQLNIASMRKTSQPVPPASPRKFMPQTDDATTWTDKAKSGMINFIEPATVNEQKFKARIGQIIKEEIKKIKR